MTMPFSARARLALLSLALPACVLATPAQAEAVSCPALDTAVQVAACPSDAELHYTFVGYCSDNARLYGRDVMTCASFENYKAVKNTALWESGDGAFSGYLDCNVEPGVLRAAKAVKISVERKSNLTRLICDYDNDQRMVMRTKASCTVDAADCSAGECRASCE